ncbi:MAG: tRNA (adenosine(37)-N6)-threonylcarbamoyltransferase complex ATPase subunit type 1 TsaE [Lentisphaeria bacterium]
MEKFISASEEQTEQLAYKLALTLKPGSIIALHGNLGCGKTVFSRGLAKALGVEGHVTSPTFTIVQDYQLPNKTHLYHLDLYRINNEDDAIAFGIDEYLLDPNAICIMEWPTRISELWPNHTIHVYFEHIDEQHRSIQIQAPEFTC